MSESIQAVAARCLADAAFARGILEGAGFPEVRFAILADLPLQENEETQGYLNPCPESPGMPIMLPNVNWGQWQTFARLNLVQLARASGQ